MTTPTRSSDELRNENAGLLQRLEEAEATIRAISNDEVDAFLVRKGEEDQVLVLDGVDRPYRLLIERMQQGAATLAADGAVIYANARLAEMIGAPLTEMLGRSLVDHVIEADRPALTAVMQRGRVNDIEHDFSFLRADGEVLPVLVTASPLVEHEGITCVIVTDLTLQKHQENQRERFLQEQSARAAAEKLAAILREADLRKDEFLATLGHELRNPLGPLRNGIQILNRISSQELVVQKTRDMMERQIECLVRLVDDLLDVSRVTQGKITLQRERVDLRDVVTRALEGCRAHIQERGEKLEVRLPELPLPVEVDVIRVAQIVTNLLNNAVKFTSPGGLIQLVCEPSDDGRAGLVRVRDNGRGIEPDMLPKIFDLFTQVDPTDSRTQGGLGIGLTLARRLTEMHGGILEASSKGLDQGSEFTLSLPLDAMWRGSKQKWSPTSTGASPIQNSGHRILIVDDNQDSAASLATLLGLLGHEVRQANDGGRALALAAESTPDVMLLDIGMPGMNGYDLALAIRSQASLKGVPLIAISGYGGEEERRKTRSAGFHGHLVKPVEIANLQSMLASLPRKRSENP